jgi:cell division protein ZapA (FtsZ GTPase activity inhibitor)
MRIEMLGTSFSVRTDEDAEYFTEVVEHFRAKVKEIQASVGTQDPLKVAILAGILASDDFIKLTGKQRRESLEARGLTESLIHSLDAALGEETTTPPARQTDQSSEQPDLG